MGNAVYESVLARLVQVSPLLARGVLDAGLGQLGFSADEITASQMLRVIDEFLGRELAGVEIEGGGGLVMARGDGVGYCSPTLYPVLGLRRGARWRDVEEHLVEMSVMLRGGTAPFHQDRVQVVIEQPFRRVLLVGRCALPEPDGGVLRISQLYDATLQEALRAEVGQVQAALDEANRTREQLARELLEQERATTRTLREAFDAQSTALVQTEKLASVGFLLGGIAHELNNLLGPILGHAQRLKGRDIGPEERDSVAQIELAARSAAGVVHSLLAMANPRAGDRQRADVGAVVREVCALFGGQWQQWGIEVVLELGDGLPATSAETGQVRSVLINLLANASQAIGRRPGRIRIQTTVEGGQVALRVEDDGGGIDEALLDRLFDPYVTGRERDGGSGMGLHIVQRNVAAVGGRVAAANVDGGRGRGARITVWLPVHAGAPEAPDPEAAPRPGAPRAVQAGRSCLVVDDEPVLRSLMCDVLCDEGFVVEGAGCATEALARLRERPYDLVISDVRMPEMDGLEMLEHLDAWQLQDRCAFLFVTGDMIDPRLRERIEALGAALLYKPFEIEAFVAAVGGALSAAGKPERPASPRSTSPG